MEKKATRVAYGEYVAKLGDTNEKLVVLDADLAGATMTKYFKKAHPDRFIDCGIAEANMVDMAAGMSTMGFIPFCSTFAVFAGRAYDQIRNTVCYPKMNVKLAFTHAGITLGEDGGSHQALEDIALMRALPNMTVFVPCDAKETERCVDAAIAINGPVYIRLARLPSPVFEMDMPFIPGKVNVLREGTDEVLLCCGVMVSECMAAAELLAAQGKNVCVVNAHTLKPFDEEGVRELAKKHKHIYSVEEHNVVGGLGDAAAAALVNMDGVELTKLGMQDVFGESGKPADLLRKYKLDAQGIADTVMGK
ncbi:MAG: transketolase C-terminal domain-containing protein [Eubacteriales bacterium]|nr:transketolase C-terminal domain-containing protein [Eubacteriales bacterium]